MSLNLPPSVTSGFTSSPSSPDFVDVQSKDKGQAIGNSSLKQGNPLNPGVILTKDSLSVPLEIAFGINNEKSASSRPSLLPLFRTRYVEDHPINDDQAKTYYQERLNSLPENLKSAIIKDKATDFDERDPDLIAGDRSLQIGAHLLATADGISNANLQDEQVAILSQQHINLPDQTKAGFLELGKSGTTFLDKSLAEIGSNDPAHDTLSNASHLLKETMNLLNFKE